MLDSLLKWARHVIDWARAAPAPDPESGDPLPGQEADYEMAVAIGTAAKLIKSEGFSGEQEARTFTALGIPSRHSSYRATTRDRALRRTYPMSRRDSQYPKAHEGTLALSGVETSYTVHPSGAKPLRRIWN
jgi:hypothetical protein